MSFKQQFGNGLLIMQMRLNKVSELIHNSTNHQNLDSAGVSVHFQEINDLVNTLYSLPCILFSRVQSVLVFIFLTLACF